LSTVFWTLSSLHNVYTMNSDEKDYMICFGYFFPSGRDVYYMKQKSFNVTKLGNAYLL
jgi:hypothetical protein